MRGVEQKMKQAPKKLSAAILLALADLEAVEKDPRYIVKMYDWHVPSEMSTSLKCEVCFAGSVMAKSLNSAIGNAVYPADFGKAWCKVFKALNYVRCGDIQPALDRFYSDASPNIGALAYPDWFGFKYAFNENELNYEENPVAFKDAMFDVATMLEVNDL